MGKIPPALRTTRLPVTTLLKNPSSLPSNQSPSPTTPQKPHHFPKKNATKKKTQLSGKKQPQKSPLQSPKSQITFNSPNLSDAKNLFTSLITTSKAPLDSRFHNSLLQSFSSISTVHDSISLLRYMMKIHPSFTPDRSTYHILLTQSCKSPDPTLSSVHQTLNLMVTDGFPPDRVTTDIAVRSLCLAGREDCAVELVKELSNAVTYTSLMNGMCREGNALGALALLEEMEAKGCSPNSCTYNTLLHGLCKSRLLDCGIEFYGLMKTESMTLESASYATFLRALCRDGRIAEAYEVFDYAVESKSLKDFAAYATLESTLKTLKKAKEKGHAV